MYLRRILKWIEKGPFSAATSNASTKAAEPAALRDPDHHSRAPKYRPIVGPGRPRDAIGTPYEMTAGLERLEYLSRMSGRPLYLDAPLKVDHYGTPSAPIWVDSIQEDGRLVERIVGCTGFPKYSHAPIWMVVKRTGRCMECGQAFELRQV